MQRAPILKRQTPSTSAWRVTGIEIQNLSHARDRDAAPPKRSATYGRKKAANAWAFAAFAFQT